MTQRFRVVPAAYVILRRTDPDLGEQVLLQLRQGTGFMDGHWATAAAGHVEEGESVFAAAVREAREELGIVVDATDLEPLTSLHRSQGNGRAIDERVDWFFSCRRWTGIPTRQEPDKSADLRWFALDDLPEPVVPHECHVYELLREGHLPAIVAFGPGWV